MSLKRFVSWKTPSYLISDGGNYSVSLRQLNSGSFSSSLRVVTGFVTGDLDLPVQPHDSTSPSFLKVITLCCTMVEPDVDSNLRISNGGRGLRLRLRVQFMMAMVAPDVDSDLRLPVSEPCISCVLCDPGFGKVECLQPVVRIMFLQYVPFSQRCRTARCRRIVCVCVKTLSTDRSYSLSLTSLQRVH